MTLESREPPRLLTVAISEEALVALLAKRHLSAEELHCATPQVRRRLRKLLLRALIPAGGRSSVSTF
ncbi:hypothetical protein ACCI51_02580 [Microbulbifer echini]|uniref:Uncharacterized protein n=1 Tax=Microbulbifer echini TaxID=1529067 RepID=A0ABV4NIL6_9GAMM|nr:hypothetical protein [uncultured Microbulbifer sp.]